MLVRYSNTAAYLTKPEELSKVKAVNLLQSKEYLRLFPTLCYCYIVDMHWAVLAT